MPTTSPRDGSTDGSVAIRVEKVMKAFGTEQVLRDISLDVRAGELLALLGPSGSGKTTLLRIIAGLDYADSGRILFGSDDATALPVQKRAVGFVFQHYALFRHMSVADNVAYGLRVRPRSQRPPKAEIVRRVADLLDLVRLGGFADRYPGQLSGGQRQRVALARALAVEPRVLLLDEPFGALDAKVRKELRRWLRDIHERTGQTTIFVTHDQDEALELADRVAILDHGRLEQVDTPDRVQTAPASESVVTFLGDAMAVDGRAENGQVFVGGRPVDVAAPPGASGPVNVYVRPWHLRIVEGPGHIEGTVARAFRSQGRQRVEVTTREGGTIVAETADVVPVEQGATVSLAITDAFLFGGAP